MRDPLFTVTVWLRGGEVETFNNVAGWTVDYGVLSVYTNGSNTTDKFPQREWVRFKADVMPSPKAAA